MLNKQLNKSNNNKKIIYYDQVGFIPRMKDGLLYTNQFITLTEWWIKAYHPNSCKKTPDNVKVPFMAKTWNKLGIQGTLTQRYWLKHIYEKPQTNIVNGKS